MNAPARPLRVFQVATGNVGSEMIKRIATHPDLELVGVHAYSADKVGKDTGEFAGAAPNGVVSGNPGCILQLGKELKNQGQTIPVRHFIEVLDASLRASQL